MAMFRPPQVDDNGTDTTGTVWNVAFQNAVYDSIDAADAATLAAAIAADVPSPAFPGTSAPTTTGTSTALAIPTGTGDLVIYANNATLLTVQGIVAGTSGQRLTVFSKGAGQVDFAHLHASGTALGKLKLFATTGLTSLAAGSGVAVFQYDATVTQWRLTAHEQGAWINTTYAAGDYTGSGSQTWTVDSGDVVANRYRLTGRTLQWCLEIVSSSVGGTPATQLRATLPVGFTFGGLQSSAAPARIKDNGATAVSALAFFSAGGQTYVEFYNGIAATANWSASTNATIVEAVMFFQVT